MHLQRVYLISERSAFRDQRLGILTRALPFRDFLRHRIAIRLDLLDTLDDGSTLRVERKHMIHERTAGRRACCGDSARREESRVYHEADVSRARSVSSMEGRAPAICSRSLDPIVTRM